MKTKIIAVLIGLLIPFVGKSQGWDGEFSQYFDDENTQNSLIINIDTSASNVWQIGPPQKNIFNSAATLPNALMTDTINYYPPNSNSSFSFVIEPEIFGFDGILALQWMQKLDMDYDYDGGVIEFSYDNGDTWENVFDNPYVYNLYGYDDTNLDTLANGDYAFSGTDTTWRDIWLCYDLSWLDYTDLHIRYTLKSDSIDNSKEGWLIDNMLVHVTIFHTINEVEQAEYMTVTPNPTNGRVNISTRKIDAFHIIEKMELVNIDGKIVQEWKETPTKFYLDISNHPNGIYFLNIKTNIKSEAFKIVLEH